MILVALIAFLNAAVTGENVTEHDEFMGGGNQSEPLEFYIQEDYNETEEQGREI